MLFISFFKKLINEHPKLFLANLITFITLGIIEILTIISIGPMASFILDNEIDTRESENLFQTIILYITNNIKFEYFLGLFVLLFILRALIEMISNFIVLKSKYYLIHFNIINIFKLITNTRFSFFRKYSKAETHNILNKEILKIGDSYATLVRMIKPIIQIPMIIIIPLIVAPLQMILFTILLSLFSIPIFFLGRIATNLGKNDLITSNAFSKKMFDIFKMFTSIIGLGFEKKAEFEINQNFATHKKAAIKYHLLNSSIAIMYMPIGVFIIVLFFYLFSNFKTNIETLTIIFFSFYRLIPLIGSLLANKTELEGYYPAHQKLQEIRNFSLNIKKLNGNKKFQDFKKISFENVFFEYEKNKPILKKINFEIESNKIISITGHSSAGKSTLIDIIIGNLEIDSGVIKIDNINFKEIDKSFYKNQISIVPQNCEFFNFSIKENLIWFNNKNNNIEVVEKALNDTECFKFINKYEKGIDTLIGDQGVELSGGEKQKLAIARALIRKPSILILDEPTSSLDNISERNILELLKKLSSKMTIIIISHKKSNLIISDRIFFLNKGILEENDSFKNLINNNDNFKKLFED